ncbi:hypothetical protein MAR_001907, partial [Mya arenaria]
YPQLRLYAGSRKDSCQTGQYYHKDTNGSGKCRKCFVCPKGYTEHLPCSKTTNRSCKPCEIGTSFSDKRGGICRNCTECEREDYSNITNPWDSGIPEYSTDFNFATRLVLIALLIFISCTFVIFLFATVLQTISTRFPSVKCFFII